MEFTINHQALEANMFTKEGLSHRLNKRIRLLPFIANDTQLKDKVLTDLEDFKGIAGACYRECLQLSQQAELDRGTFLNKICETADADGDANLRTITEKIAFNENGQLILFDILVYPHIRNSDPKENKTLTDIARFMAALWFGPDERRRLQELADAEADNLFYKLILKCLPENTPAAPAPDDYYQNAPELRDLFRADLQILLQDPDLFISGFHQLLRFYFFRYVADLALQFGHFLTPQPEQLFFSVKWEKMQDYRQAMTNGWEQFTHAISPLFSHVITLQLINHIDGFRQPVTYTDLGRLLPELSVAEKANLAAEIDALTEIYKSRLVDVPWQKFQPKAPEGESGVALAVRHLFQAVDFQFEESDENRKRARTAYQNWMKEFTVRSYGRRRGALGYSLSIDKEFLLLLTRLCVGRADKIRLKDFWAGLEQRGIYLDRVSQEHIITYFEKVSLLEKKSDSGDAQYIKKISQALV